MQPPSFGAPLAAYEARAAQVLAGHRAGEARALEFIRRCHPRYRDAAVAWLARSVALAQVAAEPFVDDDARLVVARGCDFLDWSALVEHVQAVGVDGPVRWFESAVQAVVAGDAAALASLLHAHPELVRERSTRRTQFDPAVHRATLLHYVAANGVEAHNQRSPATAPAVAMLLLRGGAEPDALGDFYGGQCTTLSLLVSSSHPAAANVQLPLIDLLLDHGASLEPRGRGAWVSPLLTALVFGFVDAAHALVRRGARVDSLPVAAGLGRTDLIHALLPSADAAGRHAALALAAQLDRPAVVELLLDAGESPDRFNPEGMHAHATPLHQAALAGHLAVVQILLAHGARLDLRDAIYQSTPLGWAEHGERAEVVACLLAAGAER